MDQNQIFVLALANVPTMIAVLIGILVNNARLGDMFKSIHSLESRMLALENRMTSLENRLDNRITHLEQKFDLRFDVLLGKIEEIDNRLTRLEADRR